MKTLWEIAIYEHKAALINSTPYAVANNLELLVQAMEKEYEIYKPDYLTVGVDIYNLEVETLGAKVENLGDQECPDVKENLYDLEELPEDLKLPSLSDNPRFQMLIDAGKECLAKFADSNCKIRVGASGPVTIAAKLVGIENLIISLCMEDGNATRLLNFANQIVLMWCKALRDNNLDVIIFDSMAAPPMFSPELFEDHILPLHKDIMDLLKDSGQEERELVIGGNTSAIVDLIVKSGANYLLCDFACDAEEYKAALGDDSQLKIRRNINPACLNDEEKFDETLKKFADELSLFSNVVAGTGILPYNFETNKLLKLKDALNNL